MSLEWFDRVSEELHDHLESICDKYDEVGHMAIDRAAKHPRIEFFVETEEDESEHFCALFFDPYNEEFYIKTMDMDFEHLSKVVLQDIEDIIDEVHESFRQYLEGSDEWEDEEWEDEGLYVEADETVEEIDVEWTTPEVTAYAYEDEVEVTYQFGVVEETGDGVLRRINRVKTADEELLEDETNFIFSKEEANTIIAMIASHADSLSELSEEHLR